MKYVSGIYAYMLFQHQYLNTVKLCFKGGLDIGPAVQTPAPVNNTLPLMNSQNNILNSLNTTPNYFIDGLGDTNLNQATSGGMLFTNFTVYSHLFLMKDNSHIGNQQNLFYCKYLKLHSGILKFLLLE